mmetsp:Transcript_66025/g.190470  ORF Transcript_66025/g.190470 Transcript_66025/m.190470 type:complete len:297 (+) Transcript_66025:2472-3362(+)
MGSSVWWSAWPPRASDPSASCRRCGALAAPGVWWWCHSRGSRRCGSRRGEMSSSCTRCRTRGSAASPSCMRPAVARASSRSRCLMPAAPSPRRCSRCPQPAGRLGRRRRPGALRQPATSTFGGPCPRPGSPCRGRLTSLPSTPGPAPWASRFRSRFSRPRPWGRVSRRTLSARTRASSASRRCSRRRPRCRGRSRASSSGSRTARRTFCCAGRVAAPPWRWVAGPPRSRASASLPSMATSRCSASLGSLCPASPRRASLWAQASTSAKTSPAAAGSSFSLPKAGSLVPSLRSTSGP